MGNCVTQMDDQNCNPDMISAGLGSLTGSAGPCGPCNAPQTCQTGTFGQYCQ
jgi:hypothetical protein